MFWTPVFRIFPPSLGPAQWRFLLDFLEWPGLLLIVVFCGGIIAGPSQEARAQESTSCADTLVTAEKAYRARNYEEATSLASQCTDVEAVADTTAIQAHRIITLASLRRGDLRDARSAVRNILQIAPEYQADPVTDPPSYRVFVSMVRDQAEIRPPEEDEITVADEEDTGPADPDVSPDLSRRTLSPFFVKPFGIGFSDYTGDMPAQSVGHPLDFQEFDQGSGFPFMLHGEMGYQFEPRWALVLGIQVGNYPIIGYNTGDNSISDSWRYTPQLLLRRALGLMGESLVFYLDGGLNVTFGGQGIAKTGYGPVVGGGVDIPVSASLSFYVESRFNFTLPDASIDGTVASEFGDAKGSVTGPFDSVNQLLGVGLRIRFGNSL